MVAKDFLAMAMFLNMINGAELLLSLHSFFDRIENVFMSLLLKLERLAEP